MTWQYPKPFVGARGHVRNGLVPASDLHTQLVYAQNHLMAFRHREVYRRAWELGTFNGASGTNTIARFRFRTGYGVTKLSYVVVLGIDDTTGGATGGLATNPYVEIDTKISGGATSTSQFFYGLNATGTSVVDAPDEWGAVIQSVTVTPATVYECAIKTVDYARLIAVCAYEQADLTVTESTDYYNTADVGASAPIYDADRQQLLQGLTGIYRQNAGTVWHWGLEDGSSRTRSSATPINTLDNSTTGTPATSDYGFYINNQYRNTESRTTVPYELAAYGSVAGGGNGYVRLIDSSGNAYGPVDINSGSAGWFTATVNLPTTAGGDFFALQHYGDGVNTVTVTNVSLIEWE